MSDLAPLERALLARLDAKQIKVPPYPAVATKLDQLSRQPRSTMTELAAVVSSDPTLVAAVLGRAHSAAHSPAGGGRTPTLPEALGRIGMQQLIELALATGLGNGAVANGPLAELRRDNWRRALLGGYLARMLAGSRGVSSETAYLAGLLYELGAVVATTGLEELAKTMPLPTLPEPRWRSFLATLEGRFGRVIATKWNLPPELGDVVAHEAAETPLGALMLLVAEIVARLDGSPTTGVAAALVDVVGLGDIERCSIGSVVQEVVKNMGAFTVPVAAAAAAAGPVEPPPRSADGASAISFEVTAGKQRGRGRTIEMSALVFEVAQAIAPGWLVDLVIHATPPLSLLANVRSCTKEGTRHVVEVKPFALEGAALEQWVQLALDARNAG